MSQIKDVVHGELVKYSEENACLIDESGERPTADQPIQGVFCLERLENPFATIPILSDGLKLIVFSWNSTHWLEINCDKTYKVLFHEGAELEEGKQYFYNVPKF